MNWAAIVGRITGSVDEHLLNQNRYLRTELAILRNRLRGRISFTNGERIALAKAAKPIGRSLLSNVATLATPDTLLRWHRELVEKMSPRTDTRERGRPPTDPIIVELVLRFAQENPSWGYDRIAGTLAELGHNISDTTVGNLLRQHGESPAPQRCKNTSWTDFISAHKDVLLGCDFFTKEVWTLLGPVTYHILFFIHVASRKVHVAGTTTNPTRRG